MDELIQRAAHGTADGLRALGSTAQIDLERFRRLVFIGQNVVSPESPPLSAFLEAIQLFADAFDSSGGFRLMRISRPPILFYGLYGMTVMEDADQRLLNLVIERGLLADQLDCFMQCACTPEGVKCQAILDKILYDVDRAIDLYALGQDDFGQPERRAAAYSFVIEHFQEDQKARVKNNASNCGIYRLVDNVAVESTDPKGIPKRLDTIAEKLRPNLDVRDLDVSNVIAGIKAFALRVKAVLSEPRTDGTSLCNDPPQPVANDGTAQSLCKQLQDAIDNLNERQNLATLLALYKKIQEAQLRLLAFDIALELPRAIEDIGILQQELCIQADTENRWENLVRSMAPNCAGLTDVFNAIGQVIDGAIKRVSLIKYPEFKPSIPPHFETSLDSIVDDVDRMGRGRPTL